MIFKTVGGRDAAGGDHRNCGEFQDPWGVYCGEAISSVALPVHCTKRMGLRDDAHTTDANVRDVVPRTHHKGKKSVVPIQKEDTVCDTPWL